jgi:pimeloyl-ACP methyl ester carboxylesterase
VLIAGLAADVSEYAGLVRGLALANTVLAFDNRGAGRTDKPDRPYSIEQMADDAAGLMQALGFRPAHVLGISMGGRIALALALRHPELVTKLVLVSASARSAGRDRWLRLFWFLSIVPTLRGNYPQPRYANIRQRQALFEYSCAERLHELCIPTAILHGKRDGIVPYRLAEELHAGIAGSTVVAFEGGHLFFFGKERQRFLAAVADFLGG